MNDIEFNFNGLVKLNIERPFLGTNSSFLRFVKHVRMDLSYDKLQRVFVTLFEIVKMKKKELINHDGESMGKGTVFHLQEW